MTSKDPLIVGLDTLLQDWLYTEKDLDAFVQADWPPEIGQLIGQARFQQLGQGDRHAPLSPYLADFLKNLFVDYLTFDKKPRKPTDWLSALLIMEQYLIEPEKLAPATVLLRLQELDPDRWSHLVGGPEAVRAIKAEAAKLYEINKTWFRRRTKGLTLLSYAVRWFLSQPDPEQARLDRLKQQARGQQSNRYYDDPWRQPKLASQHPNPPDFYEPRSVLENQVRDYLLEKDAKLTVVLHGETGIGKSELINRVGREALLYQKYPGGVLWATCGIGTQQPHVYLRAWLEMAGLDVSRYSHWSRTKWCEEVENEFKGASPLIIIDDPWQQDDLDYLKVKGIGARYVVTTSQTLRKFPAGSPELIEVPPLDLKSSEKLLCELLRPASLISDDQIQTAIKLAGGSPLALITVAEIVNRFGWNIFQEKLEQADAGILELADLTSTKRKQELLKSLHICQLNLTDGTSQEQLVSLALQVTPSAKDRPQHFSLKQASLILHESESETLIILEGLADRLLLRRIPPANTKTYAFPPLLAELIARGSGPLSVRVKRWEDYIRAMISDEQNWAVVHRPLLPPNMLAMKTVVHYQQTSPDWLALFALLRVSYQRRREEAGRLVFLRAWLAAVETMATYHSRQGVRWAERVIQLSWFGSALERAVHTHLYLWLYYRAGIKPDHLAEILDSMLDAYREVDDLYGQLASLALQNIFLSPDYAPQFLLEGVYPLLYQFIERRNLTIYDANLLLALLRMNYPIPGDLFEYCYGTALHIYRIKASWVPETFLQRAVEPEGEIIGSGGSEELSEGDYRDWLAQVKQAPFRHERAWHQLDEKYQWHLEMALG